MKIRPAIFLSILFVFLLVSNCSKKIPTTPSTSPSVTTPKNELTEKDFNFLIDTLSQPIPQDSLYVFHHEVKLHPKMITHSPFGEILWNDIAKVFITRGRFSVLNKDLDLLYLDKKNGAYKIFTYQNLPIAVGANDYLLTFYDLHKKQIINQFSIDGLTVNFAELEDNQLSVLASDGKEKVYQYFFKGSEWVKTETLEIEHISNHLAIDPSQKYLAIGSALEMKILKLEDQTLFKNIKLEGGYYRPIFSQDGTRLILIDKGFNLDKRSRIKIFSFPELEEIAEHNLSSNLIVTLKGNILLAGDEEGFYQLIDIENGKYFYSKFVSDQIYSVSILNDQEVLIGTYRNKKLRLIVKNFVTEKVISTILTSTDYVVPVGVSNDSKVFYFYENKRLSKMNLETLEVSVVKKLPRVIDPSFNVDGKMMAFRDSKWRVNLLNLEDGNLKTHSRIDAEFLFMGNVDELIFFFRDSTKTFNVKTEEWSPPWATPIRPKVGGVTQPRMFRNPLNEREFIFPSDSSGVDLITHFNELTYASKNTMHLSKNKWTDTKDFLGVDQNGDYYVSKEGKKAYRHDAKTYEIKDSIPGNFFHHYSRMESAPNRSAFYTYQNNRTFIFSPHTPNIFQLLDDSDFFWFSPDLEYFIQTKGDVIRVYKWKDDS